MAEPTRRAFLATAGVSAAAIGIGAATPSAWPPSQLDEDVGDRSAGRWTETAGADGPIVVYVTDVDSGVMSVMMGTREVVVTDRRLAARIANVVREQD